MVAAGSVLVSLHREHQEQEEDFLAALERLLHLLLAAVYLVVSVQLEMHQSRLEGPVPDSALDHQRPQAATHLPAVLPCQGRPRLSAASM